MRSLCFLCLLRSRSSPSIGDRDLLRCFFFLDSFLCFLDPIFFLFIFSINVLKFENKFCEYFLETLKYL
uniref:Uncharacterized protein n=1 Tax=Pararge aegeria TaxID=116150 RepID=S4P3T4_9NEOP